MRQMTAEALASQIDLMRWRLVHRAMQFGLAREDAEDVVSQATERAMTMKSEIAEVGASRWFMAMVESRASHKRASNCSRARRVEKRGAELTRTSARSAEAVAMDRFTISVTVGRDAPNDAKTAAHRLATLGLTQAQIAAREEVPFGTAGKRVWAGRRAAIKRYEEASE